MRDALLASASSRRLADTVKAALEDVLRDRDPENHLNEAHREFQKLASAMGYSVMREHETSGSRS